MVHHTGLGVILGLQSSSMCREHQEGFLEEGVGAMDTGEGGRSLLFPSELSPLDASIQVSQPQAHRPGG